MDSSANTNNKTKFVKRKLQKGNNKLNEIFISRKRKGTNIDKFYYNRAYELFYSTTSSYNEIYICGLGANVNQAIKTALFITEALPNTKTDIIETETISHIDEYIDEDDNNNVIAVNEERKSNLIKIKIIKIK